MAQQSRSKLKKLDDKCEEFNRWAFGMDEVYFYECAPNHLNLMLKWNARHGNLLMLNPDDLIKDSLTKMWELWEEHVKKVKELH